MFSLTNCGSAWDRLVFSGTGQAPDTVTSTEEMLARVASTPGAIGYLSQIQNRWQSQCTPNQIAVHGYAFR